MRHFLDRTRFVAYPLLVAFFLLSADAATLAYAAQSRPRPGGREEAKPHALVERARIFLDRAEETSRKLRSRLPHSGKVEAAEFFRRELEQFRDQLADQFSEEAESLRRRRMPEEARERFQLLSSRIEGVLPSLDGAFESVEQALVSEDSEKLKEALARLAASRARTASRTVEISTTARSGTER